jgi:crotonobetaine/carnitine-CoA ligase
MVDTLQLPAVPVLIRQRAEAQPSAPFITDVTGEAMTVGEFHAAATRIADAMAAMGVARGECVATMLDPNLPAYCTWIGLSWRGALEVPINPEFKGNLLAYALADCRARVIVTSNACVPQINAIRERLEWLERIITIDDDVCPSAIPIDTLAAVEAGAPAIEHVEPQLADTNAVIYTSGTTGPSKGVLQAWGSIQQVQHNFSGEVIDPDQVPVYYSPWPIFHASGRVGLVFAAVRGGQVVFRSRFSVSHYWADVRKFGCTHTQLMGIASFLMNAERRPDDSDNPMQWVLMNPVIPDFRDFEARFGVRVTTGWGMTEIGFPLNASGLPNHQTCGKLSPLYDVRIVDGEGRDLPDGEAGELLIRGKAPFLITQGYLNKPDANARSWRDGWYATGDILRRDADGFFYFVDRAKDYLRVRGNNVSSIELEGEVRAHPAVGDVAALGVSADEVPALAGSSRVRGSEDEIKIVVQLNEGAVLSEAELADYLAERLPRYMVPRFVEIVDTMPRTPTGKVQKAQLRQTLLTPTTWDRLSRSVPAAT